MQTIRYNGIDVEKRQIDRWKDRQRRIDVQMDKQTNRQYGQMDRWTYGQMQTERQTYISDGYRDRYRQIQIGRYIVIWTDRQIIDR